MTDEDFAARAGMPAVVRRLRLGLGSPVARAVILGLPLAAMTMVLGGSSNDPRWVVPSSASAGNQAWLNELVGPVPEASPGQTPGPDAPVLPANGNPQVLVLPGPGVNSGDAVSGSGGRGASAAAAVPDTGALTSNGIPVRILKGYVAAATQAARIAPSCHVSWALLAGIGRVETDHGRFGGSRVQADGVVTPPIYGPRLDGTNGMPFVHDTDGGRLDGDPNADRAVGPMQFIPGTWASFGTDGDGNGVANPQDIDDAALSAARYLCAGGGDLSTQQGRVQAVYRYNHSASYVRLVLALADSYASGRPVPVSDESAPAVTPQAGPSATGGSPPAVNPGPPPASGTGASPTPSPSGGTPRPTPTSPGPTTRPPSPAPSTSPSASPSPTPTSSSPGPTATTPGPTPTTPSPTATPPPSSSPPAPTPSTTEPTPTPTTPSPTPTPPPSSAPPAASPTPSTAQPSPTPTSSTSSSGGDPSPSPSPSA